MPPVLPTVLPTALPPPPLHALPHAPRHRHPTGALRRRSALGLGLGTALGLGCTHAPAPVDPAPFRLVPDHEPAAAVWLGHDGGHRALTTQLARALHPHVPLRLLVRGEEAAADARRLMAEAGVPAGRYTLHVDELAHYFVRDVAVFAVAPGGRLGVVDFRWTHYGLPGWCRMRHGANEARASACSAGVAPDGRVPGDALDRRIAEWRGAPVFATELVAEGGGIEVNGQGLMIANEMLVMQRNPGRSRDELDRALRRLPGVRRVIWLPAGLAEDPQMRATITGPYVGWGTGGHTDEFVRFADARTVLLAWPDDEAARSHPVARLTRQRMARNAEILAGQQTLDGQPLRVIKVPMPKLIERRVFLSAAALPGWSHEWTADFFPAHEKRREGDPVMQVAIASYLNYVVANGVVLLPDYLPHGTPRAVQDRVRGLFEQVFPGRQLVFIDAIGANWVGGGLHCATLNEPLPPA